MRSLVVAVAVAVLVLCSSARAEDGFGPVAIAPAAESFKFGSLQLTALHDAQFVLHNDGKVFGTEVGPAAVAAVLKANAQPDDRITLSVNALLVRTGAHLVLLDAGLGPKANGRLIASLQVAGIAPADITDVLITHSHGDHVGGLVDADGKLAFPNATIRMAAAEWTFMKSQQSAAELVKAIDGHVETYAVGKPILPGILPVPLEGHTPGHFGYEIESGKHRLLDIGDMAHSSLLSLQKTDWSVGFDSDSAAAKATRKVTLARLAQDHEAVFSPHFPFPGIGRVVVAGDAYSWEPGKP